MIFIILPDIPAEDQLLARARQGDQDAIERIYESYFPPVYQFIRLRVDDVNTAKDLAGDVFLKFIQALQSRNAPRRSLRGWLFRVARNLLHDHYGQRLTDTVLEEWIPASDETEPEAQFIRAAGIRQVRRALRQLSIEQQEVIILRFGNMLDLQETADIMGKNVNTVKSYQLRALQNLRRLLSQPELTDA